MGFRAYTNPYTAGDPVSKRPSFVGREDVLWNVLRLLRYRQQNDSSEPGLFKDLTKGL